MAVASPAEYGKHFPERSMSLTKIGNLSKKQNISILYPGINPKRLQEVLWAGLDLISPSIVKPEISDKGEVAVLMNNAGIARPCPSWEQADNWRQVIEVNVFGVLNCVQGFTNPPSNAGYNASKTAVKVMSEMLAYDLRKAEAPISVHLFVPGFTYTNMIASFMPEKPAAAWISEQTVDYFIERIVEGDFYVLCPDNDVTPEQDQRRVEWAMQDVVRNRPALSRWHPDFEEEFALFESNTEV
jgi:NAD(P)-dependent dehydrogenase (short-subunit alcohol dehydrogenase family)